MAREGGHDPGLGHGIAYPAGAGRIWMGGLFSSVPARAKGLALISPIPDFGQNLSFIAKIEFAARAIGRECCYRATLAYLLSECLI